MCVWVCVWEILRGAHECLGAERMMMGWPLESVSPKKTRRTWKAKRSSILCHLVSFTGVEWGEKVFHGATWANCVRHVEETLSAVRVCACVLLASGKCCKATFRGYIPQAFIFRRTVISQHYHFLLFSRVFGCYLNVFMFLISNPQNMSFYCQESQTVKSKGYGSIFTTLVCHGRFLQQTGK